ncbi:MAG: cytochrome c3 family protein [Chitinophagales bacterium]
MKRNLVVVLLVAMVAVAGGALALGLRGRQNRGEPGLVGQVAAVKGGSAFGLPGLKGATVTAEPGGFTTRTRRDGSFALRLLPGVYRLTIAAPGFVPYSSRVQVLAAVPASVWPALFPRPSGPPVAKLMRSELSPGSGPVAYNTSVLLDASQSRNVDPEGLRWEITDASGRVLTDPYAAPARPLQLKPSPVPGSSPLVFTFVPPVPGRFRVRLLLRNSFSGGREVAAEYVVVAENRSPEPVPLVIAGPNPPGDKPDGRRKEGSGLRTVLAGDKVFLGAWAIDKNYPSPELYHPAGRQPDAYGKKFLLPFSRFSWKWRLYRLKEGGGRTDVTHLLRAAGQGSPQTSPYPWFVAEQPGRYLAALWAEDHDPFGSQLGSPRTVEITVLPREGSLVEEATCAKRGCHPQVRAPQVSGGKMTCQACHGPAGPHLAAKDVEAKRATMQVSYEAAQCGRCHDQYSEWEKSRHSDGYAFGYEEIPQALLLNCTKCHYPQGFAKAAAVARRDRIPFAQVEFKKAAFPGGPRYYDFSQLPGPVGQGTSCQACHDPHQIQPGNRLGLRASRAELCGTCHADKWQNVLLEQTAGRTGSAYEYPGRAYPTGNPHRTAEGCLLCHMSEATTAKDAHGVRRVGGHTLRMRDAGPDGRLGGFGPAPDDPRRRREDYGKDDLLNLAPCQRCHPGATTFDLKGRQSEIYRLWTELGGRLAALNHGRLPGYKPGDKCATCHRGGTLPFDDDPDLVLENAYTNYKLVGNDRSWGIHNYRYTRQLLEDSLRLLPPGARSSHHPDGKGDGRVCAWPSPSAGFRETVMW